MNKIVFISLIFISSLAFAQENNSFVNYKWDLFRAVQGSIQISRETALNKRYSFSFGLIGTYASTRGLAKPYLKMQNFEYTEKSTNTIYTLSDVQAIGGGINLQLRRYLGKKPTVGSGFYLTPEVFYRFLNLESEILIPKTTINKTVNRTLKLGYLGYSVGYQKIFREVLSIDSYVGGGFFFSKYEDQVGFTRFRNVYQIDYTGFYLNMGVLIGIVK